MDELFGDQLVPHALVDPMGAETVRIQLEEKGVFVHDEEKNGSRRQSKL